MESQFLGLHLNDKVPPERKPRGKVSKLGEAPENRLFQGLQIRRIGMGQGGIEIVKHGFGFLVLLHGLIPGTDTLGHFPLAQEMAQKSIAFRQVLPNSSGNLVKIGLGSSESGSAK